MLLKILESRNWVFTYYYDCISIQRHRYCCVCRDSLFCGISIMYYLILYTIKEFLPAEICINHCDFENDLRTKPELWSSMKYDLIIFISMLYVGGKKCFNFYCSTLYQNSLNACDTLRTTQKWYYFLKWKIYGVY